MKRKPHLQSSWTPRANILSMAFCATLVLLLPGGVTAQSTRRSFPTPLRSTEVGGRANYPRPTGGGYARTFYYTFAALPGEVRAEVVTNPTARGPYEYSVSFEDERGRRLESVALVSGGGGESRRDKTFSVSRRTRVLMVVRLTGRFDYEIRLGGIEVSTGRVFEEDYTLPAPAPRTGGTRLSVPSRGTLVIRMRDGSTREIDLSLVSEMIVVSR